MEKIPLFPSEVAVLGAGLLGGSIARALQGKCSTRLWGRRSEVIESAQKQRVAEFCSTNLAEVVNGSDLVVFCTPIGTMPDIAREICDQIGSETLVTDVGSVKVDVCATLGKIFGPQRFVGSHPMAGSENSGLEAARADLFQGAVCIVTPIPETPTHALDAICQFWEKLGCEIFTMNAELHDRQVGLISHLPHLLAACQVNAVGSADPGALLLAGQGFRDSTRIASGPPAMWSEILTQNRAAVLAGMANLKEQLLRAEELLRPENEENLRKFLSAAKTKRDGIIRKVRYGGN